MSCLYENPVFYMISVIVYVKYRRGCLSCYHNVVGWRNLRVVSRSVAGSGGVVGQKKAQFVRAHLQRARWRMHENPSHSSFIGGKGTGGQKGRQYFGYPGQDPNSPSQQIQIPRSPWNFAMCCFHGLARCMCIARNIKMHFFTNSRMHARDN